MAKLNLNRLSLALVIGLVFVAVCNVAENVYSATESYITGEEMEEQRALSYASIGKCAAPKPEELEIPPEEAQTAYFDTQECVSSTSVANSMKSTDTMMSEVRSGGDVKKPHEKQETPTGGACSQSDKKVMAEQARYGANTDGLTEGKDGAETTASEPGSTAQYALISQNLQNCHEQTLTEMAQVGPSFNLYCKENPDLCSQTAQHWFAPVAVVKASTGFRNFSVYHADRVAKIEHSRTISRQVESRARQERATFDKYNYLSEALKAIADKNQEIDAKAQVQMAGIRGENPGEGLVEKFDQGGTAHNASAL
jgi:hypothetical protein